jgi:inhibitor of KinA
MTFHPLGDSALAIEFAEEYSDRERLLARALSVAKVLEGANIPGVIDVTSAYESVAVFFDLARIEQDFEEKIRAFVASAGARASGKTRRIEIPVCYDDEFALDLARVETETNLSADAIIALHSSTEYTVACIGFVPGFPFLAALSEKLRVPRLESPRTKVPAGSVAIANAQAGIYPFESPGGWNVIGRTPLRLFDANASPPALLQPGDRVRFRRIGRDDFNARVKENSK